MKRLFPLLLALGGCAHYGNLSNAPAELDGVMANDAAKAIRAVFPPGSTVLQADATTSDPFLGVLIERLRQSGYVITAPAAKGGVELHYIVDRTDADHYRVSLLIEGQALNRLYRASQGRLTPASAWSRQVSGHD